MPPKIERVLICPGCDMKVTGLEKECPSCGKKFGKDAKFKCPSCGKQISKRFQKCPSCKTSLVAQSRKEETLLSEDLKSELKSDLDELEAQTVEEAKRIPCAGCGQPLAGTEKECPNCGVLIEGATGTPQIPTAEEPQRTCPCTFCGSIIPEDLQACPVCGNSFAEAEEEVPPPGDEPTEASLPQEPAASQGKVKRRVKTPAKTRTLRSAKVTKIPPSSQTRPGGLTNGIGQVNGSGKVNGTRSEIGEAFVNGTGISNGLGARARRKSERRPSLLKRWQFLAVLVAVVIIIPTFVFLSYSNKPDRLSVDGDFADWSDATIYGTRVQSTAPTTNIIEWAVAVQSSDLFFYLSTEASMLSSSNAESYFLFVDSDGSNATGYVMESMGADYMLRLTGWNSTISSTSLSEYQSSSDQYDWNAWRSIGSLSCALDEERLEGKASMPLALSQSAKFLVVSKDYASRGSVSYKAPLKGSVLVVEQIPSPEVVDQGILPQSSSVSVLTLRFTCEGEGGTVDEVNPHTKNASMAYQAEGFTLDIGETHEVAVALDTLSATDGQLVSAEILESGIVSSFDIVEIVGTGASAYVGSPPAVIVIDGAFADWAGRLSVDQDMTTVIDDDTDIDEVGNVSTSSYSYFYVSVKGEICSGTHVPAIVAKPSGPDTGGIVILPRQTAEDFVRIYVDSDRSNLTGKWMELDSRQIGADQLIEVKGLFGKITSTKEYNYSTSGNWVEMMEAVNAAKDTQRIEMRVTAASIEGSTNIDFIVETTTWEGRSDLAVFDPYSTKAFTRSWIVDPATDSELATALSNQRKLFFDGANHWSFYFDGANTVYKYSSDGGMTWSLPLRAFRTPGVNKVSVWYDTVGGIVYAVGDTATSTRGVSVQRGVVSPALHSITWSPTDAVLDASRNSQGDKNTFISKDPSGYIWVLSVNNTGVNPTRQDLSVFRSATPDNLMSWVFTGNLIGAGSNTPNCKGSILPAGNGSDMYAIYAYGGNVASRKYTTSWSAENLIHVFSGGSLANTDTAPPSAVVDSKGVVHVVYGTSRKSGTNSAPAIEYSHNITDQTTFTIGVELDPSLPVKAGDFYPTISLETSTGNLYVLWLRTDDVLVPRTIMGTVYVSGNWSAMTILEQTTYVKQYLTSVYSAPSELGLCWQWTQNTTAPIQVQFDVLLIPEFGDLVAFPFLAIVVTIVVCRLRPRTKNKAPR